MCVLTSPIFENMGLVTRSNLHRNSDGGWGWGGIKNVMEYRLRKDRRVQASPSRKREISQIQLFLRGETPGLHAKLARTALVKGLR